MDLKNLVNSIPPMVRAAVTDVRLTPELGYWPAKFENLESLHQWLESEAGDHYRYPAIEMTEVTLPVLLKYCARPSVRVLGLLDIQAQMVF